MLMLALLLPAALAAAGPVHKPAPLLGIADLDPARVLPPPPTAGSVEAVAELAELHAAEVARTPADEAHARLDGDTRNATIFAVVLGPAFDLDKLPATARLMALVRASEKAVVDAGKDEFRRPRPY